MTSRAIVTVKLVLTALFWGGTFLAGRVAAGHIGPFSGAFLRYVMASAVLVPLVMAVERDVRVPRGELPRLALLGLFGTVLYNVFFFKGLQTVDAGRASVIIALNPAGIAVGSALFRGERLSAPRVLGVLFSLAGALTVITRGDLGEVLASGVASGDLFILGCVGSWVAFTLIGTASMERLSPLAVVAWSSLAGTVGLLGPALREGLLHSLAHSPLSVWLATGYLALFGTVLGFVWYYEGVRILGPTRAGVFINFVPASSVALGVVVLREEATASLLVGLALVTLGVRLANSRDVG